MRNPKLGNRYAKALFDFAHERDQVEVVYQDLMTMRKVLSETPELLEVLNSPVIPEAKKHAIFTNVFKEVIGETLFSFLDIIIKKKREPMLCSICDEFEKYYNEEHKLKIVTLTSASKLSDELVEKIRAMLMEEVHYDIRIDQVVNPAIIGGVILKMDDFFFDASVVSKINKLKQEFAHNSYQVNF